MKRRLLTAGLALGLGLGSEYWRLRAAGTVRAQSASPSAPRVALLIGNAAYGEAPLRNPVNDVRELAGVLQALRAAGALEAEMVVQ